MEYFVKFFELNFMTDTDKYIFFLVQLMTNDFYNFWISNLKCIHYFKALLRNLPTEKGQGGITNIGIFTVIANKTINGNLINEHEKSLNTNRNFDS